jgi:dihydroorotate dehydrogenase electron transfer subunit
VTTAEQRLVQDCVTPVVPASEMPVPTWHNAAVLEQGPLAAHYQYLRLSAPSIAATSVPGQFVMLTAARSPADGPVLPRPMAIFRRDASEGAIEIIYGVVGDGTRKLATFGPADSMLVVGPLGHGFRISPDTRRVLLIGRGIGICSLTTVAQDLAAGEVELIALSSGRTRDALIGTDHYRACGADRIFEVTDAEGTSSADHVRTLLIDQLDAAPPDQIMVCGSDRLTWLAGELGRRWAARVQVSLEAHMACGLGYCHGCATGTRGGPRESPLICKDGPVFWFDGADTER